MRAGGKIRFGAKIRVSEDDMIGDLDFGGVYVMMEYQADTNGHKTALKKRTHVESITVKKRAANLDLASGQININEASQFRNDGMHPKVASGVSWPRQRAGHSGDTFFSSFCWSTPRP